MIEGLILYQNGRFLLGRRPRGILEGSEKRCDFAVQMVNRCPWHRSLLWLIRHHRWMLLTYRCSDTCPVCCSHKGCSEEWRSHLGGVSCYLIYFLRPHRGIEGLPRRSWNKRLYDPMCKQWCDIACRIIKWHLLLACRQRCRICEW